jgi:hypothetical protein
MSVKLSKTEAGALLMECLAGMAGNASGTGSGKAGPAVTSLLARQSLAAPAAPPVARHPGPEMADIIRQEVQRNVAQLIADGVLVEVAKPKPTGEEG